MKISMVSARREAKGEVDLPPQFDEAVRADLIKRAVLTIQANSQQPYGPNRGAGMRASADLSRRRRKYRGSYGHGISRVPRKIHTRRGTRMFWVGAVAPGMRGGRRAHPPKPYTNRNKKINVQERKKAIRSSMAATIAKDIVALRGHHVPDTFPFIVDHSFETITKTKDAHAALKKLGLEQELARVAHRTIRAGKGTSRGRKYKSKVGPLVVVSDARKAGRGFSNIPGVDVVGVHEVNAAVLAPGAVPGRLTIWTHDAIKKLREDHLFM